MVNELKKNQLESLLRQQPNALKENNPSPAWWKVVKNFQINPYSVTAWVVQNLEHPDMVKAFVAHPPEDQNFISAFEREFINEKQKIKEPFRQAWNLILYKAKNYHNFNHEHNFERWSNSKKRMNNGDYGQEVRESIVDVISPHLKIGVSMSHLERLIEGKEEEKNKPITLGDLMHLEFETDIYISADEILASWKSENMEQTFNLCRDLTHRMIQRLDFAKENDLEHSAAWDVPSIASHEQNDGHHHDFYPIVRLTIDLWERLDEENALKIADIWRNSQNLILIQRMFLHALAKDKLYNGQQAAESLLALDGDRFWDTTYGRKKEIATLLEKRWQSFNDDQHQKLEARILAGPPRKKYRDDLAEEEWVRIRKANILQKLRALKNGKGKLHEEAEKEFKTLEKKLSSLPGWQTYFDSFSSSSVGEQGDPLLLKNISVEQRIDKAQKLQEADPFRQGDIWRKYCFDDPKGALEALQAKANKQEWPAEEWGHFFGAANSWKKLNRDDESDQSLIENIFKAIENISNKKLEAFIDSASFWMKEILHIFNEEQRLALWDKMMGALEYRDRKKKKKNDQSDDPFTDAMNRAEGRLTEIVFLWSKQRKRNEGFEKEMKPLMDRLVKLQNYSGALIRSTMMPRLDYLYFIDPQWTTENLLSWLSENPSMSWVLWDGYKYNNYMPKAELFNEMKPAILKVIQSSGPDSEEKFVDDHNMKNRLTWLLILVLLYRSDQGYALNTQKVRQILREVNDEARSYILRNLRINLREKSKEEKKQKIEKLFSEIWPLDAKFITEGILSDIIELIVGMGDAFPESLAAAKNSLRLKKSEYYSYMLARDSGNEIYLPKKFPREMLELLNRTIDRDTILNPHSSQKLKEILEDIRQAKPELADDRHFRKMINLVNR